MENRNHRDAKLLGDGTWVAIYQSASNPEDQTTNCEYYTSLGVVQTDLDGRAHCALGGHIIAVAQSGGVFSVDDIQRYPQTAPWALESSNSACVAWKTVLRLRVPIPCPGQQGVPTLTEARAITHDGTRERTPEQIQKSEQHAAGRRAASQSIVRAIQSGQFDVTRCVVAAD